MKILNGNYPFYLTAVHQFAESKTAILSFRQGDKYILRRSRDNQFDYTNVLLLITFCSVTEAKDNVSLIKDFYLNTTVSIELLNENELEFNGEHDVIFKIEKYQEDISDQFMEDWVDRYLFATNKFFKASDEINEKIVQIENIRTLSEGYMIKNRNNLALMELCNKINDIIRIKDV